MSITTWFQNLNEQPGGGVGVPTKGRASLNFWDEEITEKISDIHVEWDLFSHHILAQLGVNPEEGTISISAAGKIPYVHLAVSSRHLRKLFPSIGVTEQREVRVSFHDEALWWSFWRDPWGDWSSKNPPPKWQEGNFAPLDCLFGRKVFTQKVISTHEVEIPLPEGNYKATIEMKQCTWSRPKGPFSKTRLKADINIPGGIPVPGSGESAWNCGDDAVYSLWTDAKNVADAIGQTVQHVLMTRQKHGGIERLKWEVAPNGTEPREV